MPGPLVAAIQIDSQDDPEQNWARAQELARRAAARGARLIAFPENLLYEGADKALRHPLERWGPRFAALARELEVTLVPGTIREPLDPGLPEPERRRYNTCLAYGPDGQELARYRKLHLFDVDVPGGPNERESDDVAPGEPDGLRVFEAPGVGTVGLAVCYDLRFPELFRALVSRGATTIVLPSSFALGTGKDHWLVLLRARAIENQVYLLAPDQFGKKPHGRVKFGKTAVVDPWGSVLGLARDVGEDVVVVELDPEHQAQVRRSLPCLDHRRL
ncbi:MAG: nitrilase-related carbon-nitrogen hydrolase [Planctomycetota bacterium]